jgi:selenocysteine-specific elongation factor
VEEVKKKIEILLKGTKYENTKIIEVSGLTGKGIEDVRETLKERLTPPVRQWVGAFKMPIDHAFTIAGSGTVLTGTIHRGKVKVKDTIEIKPNDKSGQVRSLRSFGEEKEEAIAGERIGIGVKGIKPEDAHRGFIACTPGSIKPTKTLLAELSVDKFLKTLCNSESRVSALLVL